MAKLTQDFIAERALLTTTGDCGVTAHGDCTVTHYKTAEKTYSGKAHAYWYSVHSFDGQPLTSGLPYCGSRNRSTSSHGSFVAEVTCGRCF